jgi:AGZA family xanthine/uracil permease-like MFS transporter
VEKHFRAATLWAVAAAVLSATGIIHGLEITRFAIVNSYGPASTGLFIIACLMIAAIYFTFSLRQKSTSES